MLLLFQCLFAKIIFAQVPSDTPSISHQDTLTKKQSPDSTKERHIIRPVSKKPSIPRRDTLNKEQVSDSIKKSQMMDSVFKRPISDSGWKPDLTRPYTEQFTRQLYRQHPYFGFFTPIIKLTSDKKEFRGKEGWFYALMSLLLLFALFRESFPKYMDDLYRLFFRTTLKQRQIREQLIQTPLPSLLLNLFFFVISGLYITMILRQYKMAPIENSWLLFIYCTLALAVMYSVKFLGLKFSGWLFSMADAADSYIFIVFIINKVIGIFLLPFLILLAFTEGNFYKIALTLSWLGITCLLVYRFILTYVTVRNQIKVNPFHFLVYLLAFEIIPLLLIYKLLLVFF
jgi:hypothetical protein